MNNDDIDPDKNVYNLLHEDCRYYLPCELQDAIGRLDVSNKLSILHINARSMLGKLGQIDVLLKAILDGFDILAVSETWESTFNEQLINIPGYTKISSIRPHGKIGGGVAMFVKQTLNISQHISFSVTSFGSLFIEISNEKKEE